MSGFMEDKRKPGHSLGIAYTVRFRPGRYKYMTAEQAGLPTSLAVAAGGHKCYVIGREDDGKTVAFCFEEEEAKHICLGLNIIDAHLTGDTAQVSAIMRAFETLKKR